VTVQDHMARIAQEQAAEATAEAEVKSAERAKVESYSVADWQTAATARSQEVERLLSTAGPDAYDAEGDDGVLQILELDDIDIGGQ
jgi:hypothetical protein